MGGPEVGVAGEHGFEGLFLTPREHVSRGGHLFAKEHVKCMQLAELFILGFKVNVGRDLVHPRHRCV